MEVDWTSYKSILMYKFIPLIIVFTCLLYGKSYSNDQYATLTSASIQSDYTALRAIYLNTDGDNWDSVASWMTRSQFIADPTMPPGTDMGSWTGVTLHPDGTVKELDLQAKKLNGQIPIEIGGFCNIKKLNLSNNTLSGSIPASIVNLIQLTHLSLGGNTLSGEIPVGFSANPDLEILSLKNNDLTGPIPSDIGMIGSLQELSLQENQLTGPIPVTLGNLTSLIRLHLQENYLSGTIPAQIGSLNQLSQLLLFSNLLTGRIPASIGNLNLTFFVVNDNDLSGCYDSNLQNLCSSSTSFNSLISEGNAFCTTWEAFCSSQTGACGSTENDDAYCYCESIRNLSSNPESERIEKAAYKITSDDFIDYPVPSIYTAGSMIAMNSGFEVVQGSELHAYIESCDEECAVSEPCESSPCAQVDFELDDDGNKYVPNQITVYFPNGIMSTNEEGIKNYLDSIFFNDDFIENDQNLDYISFQEGTLIEKCLCAHDIFLYTIDPQYIIDEEGGGIAANSSGGPKSEGPSYSLNHFIDAGLLNEDAPDTLMGNPSFSDTVLNTNTAATVPVVAFLDSGINPDKIPTSSLLGFTLKSNVLVDIGCQNEPPYDTYGWNFVERNADVTDRRGHGTAVYLSYLNALQKIGLNIPDQSSLIIKVLNDCGTGTAYDAACGISYAAQRGADIINISWGLYTNNLILQDVIEKITNDNDILISCSSGNRGEDIASAEHFPSGYAYTYPSVVDPQTGATEDTYLPELFEVGGLCRSIAEESCWILGEEISIWSSSNYRGGEAGFAEAAIEIQDVVDDGIKCGIMGTSYAAPQFTAALVKEIIEVGINNVDQDHMFFNSASWSDPSTNYIYHSYILANDQLCN